MHTHVHTLKCHLNIRATIAPLFPPLPPAALLYILEASAGCGADTSCTRPALSRSHALIS